MFTFVPDSCLTKRKQLWRDAIHECEQEEEQHLGLDSSWCNNQEGRRRIVSLIDQIQRLKAVLTIWNRECIGNADQILAQTDFEDLQIIADKYSEVESIMEAMTDQERNLHPTMLNKNSRTMQWYKVDWLTIGSYCQNMYQITDAEVGTWLHDQEVQSGVILRLVEALHQLGQVDEHAMLRKITRNLCRGNPQFPYLSSRFLCLFHSTDDEALTDTRWALSYLSDGTNKLLMPVKWLLYWQTKPGTTVNTQIFTESRGAVHFEGLQVQPGDFQVRVGKVVAPNTDIWRDIVYGDGISSNFTPIYPDKSWKRFLKCGKKSYQRGHYLVVFCILSRTLQSMVFKTTILRSNSVCSYNSRKRLDNCSLCR